MSVVFYAAAPLQANNETGSKTCTLIQYFVHQISSLTFVECSSMEDLTGTVQSNCTRNEIHLSRCLVDIVDQEINLEMKETSAAKSPDLIKLTAGK